MSEESGFVEAISGLVSIVLVVGIGIYNMQPMSTSKVHAEKVAANNASVEHILENRKTPVIETSLDWENASMRYELLNSRGRIGWIYVVSAEGVLMMEEPVMGKLTALETFVSPMEEIQRSRADSDDDWEYFTVEMNDIDGTYGENAGGIFWFDPDGVYNEAPIIGATILYSAERKSVAAEPLIKSHYDPVRAIGIANQNVGDSGTEIVDQTS